MGTSGRRSRLLLSAVSISDIQSVIRRLLDGAQRQRAIGSRGRSRFRRHPAVSGNR